VVEEVVVIQLNQVYLVVQVGVEMKTVLLQEEQEILLQLVHLKEILVRQEVLQLMLAALVEVQVQQVRAVQGLLEQQQILMEAQHLSQVVEVQVQVQVQVQVLEQVVLVEQVKQVHQLLAVQVQAQDQQVQILVVEVVDPDLLLLTVEQAALV
tara:strand:+ start:226 stop:684 length:459 start_codon:yes stop_codon:yes gene_type:complete